MPHIEATLQAYPDFFRRPATQTTFVAAVLALEVQAVRTKFPSDQAKRLRKGVLHSIREIDTADLAAKYIRLDHVFTSAVDGGQNPFEAYGAAVFREFDLREYLSFRSGGAELPNPVHGLLLVQQLMRVATGWWKRFMDNRVLVR